MMLITVHHHPHLRAAERLGEEHPDHGVVRASNEGTPGAPLQPPHRKRPEQRMGAAPGQARFEPRTRSPVHEAVVIVRRLRIGIDAVAPNARVENGSLGDVLGNTSRSRWATALLALSTLGESDDTKGWHFRPGFRPIPRARAQHFHHVVGSCPALEVSRPPACSGQRHRSADLLHELKALYQVVDYGDHEN